VDIVKINLELAFVDENEQKDYYQLFNIKTGVLCTANGVEEYIELYKKEYKNKKPYSCSFYAHVLDYPIIYSDNFNYQFLYLYSFGKKEPIRKRKYDIVNIDEVDNMLIVQMSSPAIIGNKFNFFQFKKFLKIFMN
jgi:preprotein translocase subunit SecA